MVRQKRNEFQNSTWKVESLVVTDQLDSLLPVDTKRKRTQTKCHLDDMCLQFQWLPIHMRQQSPKNNVLAFAFIQCKGPKKSLLFMVPDKDSRCFKTKRFLISLRVRIQLSVEVALGINRVAPLTVILCCFSYELGTGPANITSRNRVDDGRPHKITAIRYVCHPKIIPTQPLVVHFSVCYWLWISL